MANVFDSVQVKKPSRNGFNVGNHHLLTCNMGELIPVFVMDCVPGDKVQISCESLVRFAPMVAPIYGRIDSFVHYFAVPKRLLWDNYENWLTGTQVGGVVPAKPYLEFNGASGATAVGTLQDYLGLPTWSGALQHKWDAMFNAAYQFIFNEYYRDENLYNAGVEIPYKLIDGVNNANWTALSTLRRRAWSHDYFTSCLPFAQKGPAVTVPISGDVTLKTALGTPGKVRNASAHATIQGALTSDASGNFESNSTDSVYDPNGTLEVAGVNTTIAELRRAYALQRYYEVKARGGTRMTEYNQAIYNVRGSDARLQRPEYITGAFSPVQISEVLNTTGTTGQLPQGNMSGHGIGVVKGQYGSYFCEEQCIIMGIMSIMPKSSYCQGIPRHFSKLTSSDEEFNPFFENIGEQAVLNKEVYADNAVNPDAAFGYIPRYSEYKYTNNQVSGEFKTSQSQWTLARLFSGIPSLNESFISCDPSHRIFAVTDPNVDKLLVHHHNRVWANRPMQKYGNPI